MDQATDHDLSLHSWASDASAAPVHALLIQHGDSPFTRVSIGRFPFVVGRGRPASLVLKDRTIARTHCRLEQEGDMVVIRDLGSKTGTFLNGTLVTGSVPLVDGHLIRIGNHTLRYLRRGRTEDEEAAALMRERQEASAYVAAILPERLTDGAVLTDYLFQPSAQLSGDAFGYQWLDDQWFTVFMLDVAGHGTAAALHAVSAANAIRQRMLPGVDFRDPTSVLAGLNRVYPMDRHDERFFTIWYGAYDRRTRMLRFASGGHHPGYLVHPRCEQDNEQAPVHAETMQAGSMQAQTMQVGQSAEAVRAGSIRERPEGSRPVDLATSPLATRNPAIGITRDRLFEARSVYVPEGAALHLFSDGAFEHTSRSMDLQDFVALLPKASNAGGPRRLYDAVLARSGLPEDDFSTLLIRFV